MDEKIVAVKERGTQSPEIIRKIAEALPKDVGRGLARLDPADMVFAGVFHRHEGDERVDFFMRVNKWSGQPVNVEPEAGVAVRVTMVPEVNAWEQVGAQLIPAGELTTVPVPEPV